MGTGENTRHDQEWDQSERGETPLQRLDRNWGDLLQELRVVQTGVHPAGIAIATVTRPPAGHAPGRSAPAPPSASRHRELLAAGAFAVIAEWRDAAALPALAAAVWLSWKRCRRALGRPRRRWRTVYRPRPSGIG